MHEDVIRVATYSGKRGVYIVRKEKGRWLIDCSLFAFTGHALECTRMLGRCNPRRSRIGIAQIVTAFGLLQVFKPLLFASGIRLVTSDFLIFPQTENALHAKNMLAFMCVWNIEAIWIFGLDSISVYQINITRFILVFVDHQFCFG